MTGSPISRTTLVSFLLTLLLFFGLRVWNDSHRDACSNFLAGDTRAPSTMHVEMGSRTVVVPCNDWIERMPIHIQVLCLLELVFAAVFLMNGLGDLRDWWDRRRRTI